MTQKQSTTATYFDPPRVDILQPDTNGLPLPSTTTDIAVAGFVRPGNALVMLDIYVLNPQEGQEPFRNLQPAVTGQSWFLWVDHFLPGNMVLFVATVDVNGTLYQDLKVVTIANAPLRKKAKKKKK